MQINRKIEKKNKVKITITIKISQDFQQYGYDLAKDNLFFRYYTEKTEKNYNNKKNAFKIDF